MAAGFLIYVETTGKTVEATLGDFGGFQSPLCPECGGEIQSAWADDGEADDADWWECDCSARGAFVKTDDPDTTLNGVPRDAYSTTE